MKDLIHRCREYLVDTLGTTADLSKDLKTGSLPFFLHDHYDFYLLRLFNKTFVVMAAKRASEITPASIFKHTRLVHEKLQYKAVLLCEAISSHNRKRLIAYKVPFIVPGNQMYLPDLAIDLKEHFNKPENEADLFSPATIAMILYVLNRHTTNITQKELAIRLEYSKMTISRAVKEVESAGLAKTASTGKNRVVQFGKDRRQLWKKALPRMNTPVTKTLWVEALKGDFDVLLAGESALAEYSMLVPPELPVYAMPKKAWNTSKAKRLINIAHYPEEAEMKLELWRYNPRLLTTEKTVDPFSLFLSRKETGMVKQSQMMFVLFHRSILSL